MTKRYYNIKETSEYTSLPIKTLYDWASQGKIPSIKIGRRVLFDINEIDRIMKSFKRTDDLYESITNKIIGDIHDNDL